MRNGWLATLRGSEWLLIAFFCYICAFSLWRVRAPATTGELAFIIPLAIVAVARADLRSKHRGWRILRDWAPAALVLVAYWSIDWVPHALRGPSDRAFENALVRWDRAILDDFGLRSGIEWCGALVPAILEIAYSLLYAVLPLTIAGFYARRERHRLEDFLVPFLLGTLTAYALIPHFPSVEPRVAFPGQDLPRIETPFRRFNVRILDSWDIYTSVFPSGHVAVGFSAAFAMWLAAPERRIEIGALLALALLVWADTIYSRYHYAADGLAGLAISAFAALVASGLRGRTTA